MTIDSKDLTQALRTIKKLIPRGGEAKITLVHARDHVHASILDAKGQVAYVADISMPGIDRDISFFYRHAKPLLGVIKERAWVGTPTLDALDRLPLEGKDRIDASFSECVTVHGFTTKAVKSLAKASKREPSDRRPNLAHVHIIPDRDLAFATDGHRMRVDEEIACSPRREDTCFAVPREAIVAFTDHVEGDPSLFHVSKDDRDTLIECASIRILCKGAGDLTPPNYNLILGHEYGRDTVVLDRKASLSALKALKPLARKDGLVTLTLTQSEASASAAYLTFLPLGFVESTMVNEKREVHFDVRYLIDALQADGDEEVVLELSADSRDQARIQSTKRKAHTVVMPMRK